MSFSWFGDRPRVGDRCPFWWPEGLISDFGQVERERESRSIAGRRVEVVRVAPPADARWSEGFGNSWDNFTQRFATGGAAAARPQTARGLGCWFFVLRGTGIWMDVPSNILTFDNTAAAVRALGVGEHEPWCTDAAVAGIFVRNRGLKPNHKLPEYVSCSAPCLQQPLQHSCVPDALWTQPVGANPNASCRCDAMSPVLHCGVGPRVQCVDAIYAPVPSSGTEAPARSQPAAAHELASPAAPNGSEWAALDPPPLHSSCTAHEATHVAFVHHGARASLEHTMRAAADAQRKSRCPVCAHILTDAMAHAERALALQRRATRGDGGVHAHTAVWVHNASLVALRDRLGAEGRLWMPLLAARAGHEHTLPMIFAHELLPHTVSQVVMLDSAVVALDDVCELARWGASSFETTPEAVVAFAHEQTNMYRYSKDWRQLWTRAGCAPGCGSRADNNSRAYFQGVNSGVGLYHLDRLRDARTPSWYHWLVPKLRNEVASGRFDRMEWHTTGSQAVFSLAAARFPSTWRRLFVPLPCEWNWQASRGSIRPWELDFTCHSPPRLYHANAAESSLRALATQLQRAPAERHETARRTVERAMHSSVTRWRYCAARPDVADALQPARERCNATFLVTSLVRSADAARGTPAQ